MLAFGSPCFSLPASDGRSTGFTNQTQDYSASRSSPPPDQRCPSPLPPPRGVNTESAVQPLSGTTLSISPAAGPGPSGQTDWSPADRSLPTDWSPIYAHAGRRHVINPAHWRLVITTASRRGRLATDHSAQAGRRVKLTRAPTGAGPPPALLLPLAAVAGRQIISDML